MYYTVWKPGLSLNPKYRLPWGVEPWTQFTVCYQFISGFGPLEAKTSINLLFFFSSLYLGTSSDREI